ncbi:MAG: twin-arginine translocation signal domain-containing protein, partial [Verrucomicrobia bacterium]|nr:twin-arginine translocation signal domain-containing protein [Verrucomicrobiota bacterium]
MISRRHFLRELGITAGALPFLSGLQSFGAPTTSGRKQRLIFMFSPNGTLPAKFWPGEKESLSQSSILAPLAP